MSQEEKFSDDEVENLRIENELLRIKLRAQYGDAFQMESNANLPPEIENQFLKNIAAFEEASENPEITTVYEKLGKPAYKSADELSAAEISIQLSRINAIIIILHQAETPVVIPDGFFQVFGVIADLKDPLVDGPAQSQYFGVGGILWVQRFKNGHGLGQHK